MQAQRAQPGRQAKKLDGVTEAGKTAKHNAPAARVLATPKAVGIGSVASADGVTLCPCSREVALQGKHHPPSAGAPVRVCSGLLTSIEAVKSLSQPALLQKAFGICECLVHRDAH